ncbi:MAG: pyridoxal phosphate-dependent aminotransferase [Bacteroidales bacterium]|nr:pyridoxal phosphate-dependent aminotransferase [Bacteroidales bacterium]
MKINTSGAQYSKITAISERVHRLEKESGEKYLYLNQGVNSVVNISLNELVKQIDFNTREVQVYAPMKGRTSLKERISHEYFGDKANLDNILISNGGMSGLDLVFQSIEVDKVFVPTYFWGSYFHILKIRNMEGDFYEDFSELEANPELYKDSAVIICDPNNPLGDKYDDQRLISIIRALNNVGCTIIVDSPYRKIFYNNDYFFEQLAPMENVVIVESFSKSLGLSGQRIGFVYSSSQELNTELAVRLMYANNGVNAFAQLLVEKLFSTMEGRTAIQEFKRKTTCDIYKNIKYLRNRGLLAEEFYKESEPIGIFAVVSLSEEELLKHNIASVSLSFFTRKYKEKAENYARICVSVPNDELQAFFDKIQIG